ncbi:hypothetical protein [Nostoc sp. JL33]|uniref:hypothetical protein n=1 Tax=Nostoc sp. JL33 TaxID=2815396 RepID=UPI0025D9D842|nr:hypothetical protein [Nostoc sp. JL33]MBN3870880.1 hypothetical protein [Nostoc sp. JL33]
MQIINAYQDRVTRIHPQSAIALSISIVVGAAATPVVDIAGLIKTLKSSSFLIVLIFV